MASVHVWNIGDKLSSAVRYTFLVLIAINKRVSWDRTTTFTSTGVFQIIPVEVVLSEYKPPCCLVKCSGTANFSYFQCTKKLSDLLLQFVCAKLSITVSTASLI
jgi:hypothetical protein